MDNNEERKKAGTKYDITYTKKDLELFFRSPMFNQVLISGLQFMERNERTIKIYNVLQQANMIDEVRDSSEKLFKQIIEGYNFYKN